MSKKSLSSRLKKRIIIEEPIRTADGAGGFTITWNRVGDAWVEIVPKNQVSNRESFDYGKLNNNSLYSVVLRYREDIKHTMRLVVDGQVLNIRAIINPDFGRKTLEIIAESGVGV